MAADDRARAPAENGLSCAFERTLDAPGAARHFVSEVLDQAGVADVLDEARLVVTELAANAVEHARSGFTVGVDLNADTVLITVSDDSPRRPTPRPVPSVATGGRGLVIVAALSERWGSEPVGGGKTIWAQLRRTPGGLRSDREPVLGRYGDHL